MTQYSRFFKKIEDRRETIEPAPPFLWKKSEEARHIYAQVRILTRQKRKNIPAGWWILEPKAFSGTHAYFLYRFRSRRTPQAHINHLSNDFGDRRTKVIRNYRFRFENERQKKGDIIGNTETNFWEKSRKKPDMWVAIVKFGQPERRTFDRFRSGFGQKEESERKDFSTHS
jgi:hypothetical protein